MTELDDDALPGWVQLAADALSDAATGQMPDATKTVARIVSEHGLNAIPEVLIGWIDTAWDLLYPDGLPDGFFDTPMVFRHEPTGAVDDVDSVPPPVRWAGRFIQARLSDDEDQVWALVGSVRTAAEWGQNVIAVLDACATPLSLGLARMAAKSPEQAGPEVV